MASSEDKAAIEQLEQKTIRLTFDGVSRYATPLLRKPKVPTLHAPPMALMVNSSKELWFLPHHLVHHNIKGRHMFGCNIRRRAWLDWQAGTRAWRERGQQEHVEAKGQEGQPLLQGKATSDNTRRELSQSTPARTSRKRQASRHLHVCREDQTSQHLHARLGRGKPAGTCT